MIRSDERDPASIEYQHVPHWPQDSIYTVLSRFTLVNGFTNAMVEELFTGRGWRQHSRTNIGGLETQAFVDSRAALAWLADSQESLDTMFLRSLPVDRGGPISPFLRYCSICMGSQRHLVFFQREQHGQCPFHGLPLVDRCRACGMQAAYTWKARLFVHPFCCPRCAAPLGVAEGRVFYDVLTPRREALLSRYSRISSGSVSIAPNVQGSCPGFILTLPKVTRDGWHDLNNMPLRELRSEQVNWILTDGFVQLRTKSNGLQKTELQYIEEMELLACLKSVLRHIKKTWAIRRLARKVSSSECSSSEQPVCTLWAVYCTFCRYWESKINPDEMEDGMTFLQNAKADGAFSCMDAPEVKHWPPTERAWYLRHRFLEHVLDSLARCIETSAWSADVSENIVDQYIRDAARPLWPLEYIDEQGKTSYRIIRHRRYLDTSLAQHLAHGR